MSLPVFLMLSQAAFAQGLGEISLTSRLDEPLLATIELLDVGNLDPRQIEVTLGTPEDFNRLNLERPAFLSSIRMDVVVEGNASVVLLTSDEKVPEPFLNLIVSARWPNGRTLRNYTLLMDLPDTAGNTAQAPRPALAGTAVTQATTPAPATAPATAIAAGNVPVAPSAAGDSHLVDAGESLWEIAEQTRPSNGVSVQQMMLAIQRANEDAFINNNINRLITGRVLRIPTAQEISILDQEAAVAQVTAQNRELGAQPLAVNRSGSTGGGGQLQDELTVLTQDSATLSGGSSDLAATIAALENEMMLSEENLDRARLENEELSSRLGSIEEEIDLLRNIIAIEDQRIAQLQAELAARGNATEAALAEARNAAAALNNLDSNRSGFWGGVMAMLENSVVLLGGLLALVLFSLGYLVFKRRRDAAEAEEYGYPSAASERVASYRTEESDSPGIMGAFLARFRRADKEEDELDEYDSYEEEFDDDGDVPTLTAMAPAAGSRTDQELAGKALADADQEDDDLGSLHDALDDVDEFDVEIVDIELDDDDLSDAESSREDALNEAREVMAELDNIDLMAASAGSEHHDDDLDSEDPESFEFSLAEVPPSDLPAGPRWVGEIEAVDFKPGDSTDPAEADDVTAAGEEMDADVPSLEVVNFSYDAAVPEESETGSTAEAEEEPPLLLDNDDEEVELELANMTFDDSMLADSDDEDDGYSSGSAMDECDTKLDLAVALHAMGETGDLEDAFGLLDEVISEGSSAQVEAAEKLKQDWRSV